MTGNLPNEDSLANWYSMIGKKGAKARNERLSAEKRKELATKASKAAAKARTAKAKARRNQKSRPK